MCLPACWGEFTHSGSPVCEYVSHRRHIKPETKTFLKLSFAQVFFSLARKDSGEPQVQMSLLLLLVSLLAWNPEINCLFVLFLQEL